MATCLLGSANVDIIVGFLIAYILFLTFTPEHRNEKLADVGKVWKRVSFVPACVLAILTLLSYPLGAVLEHWIRGCNPVKRRRRIDGWIVLWFCLTLLLLPWVRSLPTLVIFPLMRLFDLLYTLFQLLIFRRAEASKARSLILLLIHFTEIVGIFACVYVFVQSMNPGDQVFRIDSSGRELNWLTALYFSLVSASTLGYGDVTVTNACLGFRGCSVVIAAHAVIFFEIGCVIFVTAFSIPRALSIKEEIDLSR